MATLPRPPRSLCSSCRPVFFLLMTLAMAAAQPPAAHTTPPVAPARKLSTVLLQLPDAVFAEDDWPDTIGAHDFQGPAVFREEHLSRPWSSAYYHGESTALHLGVFTVDDNASREIWIQEYLSQSGGTVRTQRIPGWTDEAVILTRPEHPETREAFLPLPRAVLYLRMVQLEAQPLTDGQIHSALREVTGALLTD